jgi:hypothetical protein
MKNLNSPLKEKFIKHFVLTQKNQEFNGFLATLHKLSLLQDMLSGQQVLKPHCQT